jgi:hypothetical protein
MLLLLQSPFVVYYQLQQEVIVSIFYHINIIQVSINTFDFS